MYVYFAPIRRAEVVPSLSINQVRHRIELYLGYHTMSPWQLNGTVGGVEKFDTKSILPVNLVWVNTPENFLGHITESL